MAAEVRFDLLQRRGRRRYRACERECGDAEDGDDARTQIDGQTKPPIGRHDAQDDGDHAHRQIGQQIESGEHGAALLRGARRR